jgi:hypothetical protein
MRIIHAHLVLYVAMITICMSIGGNRMNIIGEVDRRWGRVDNGKRTERFRTITQDFVFCILISCQSWNFIELFHYPISPIHITEISQKQ